MDTDNKKVNLTQLLLDPNNYRFVDAENYVPVALEDVVDVRVQQRTRNLLLGKGQENVRDLIVSFRNNGFLDIEAMGIRGTGTSIHAFMCLKNVCK
jgi:hypothetical protein